MAEELFDNTGRLIPVPSERVYSFEDRKYFSLEQPQIDFKTVFARLTSNLQLDFTDLTSSNFESQALALKENLMKKSYGLNLFKGIHVPFILPSMDAADIHTQLQEIFIPGVRKSYFSEYPQYEFHDFSSRHNLGRMDVVQGSRYNQLIEKLTNTPVVGWYFPNPLAGFAIPDQRTLISRLPEEFLLSGPLEAAAALVGAPNLLMKSDGKYPNLLALTSVEPNQDNAKHFFWFFEAYGWNLNFNLRSMNGAVSEYFAGGLTIVNSIA